MLNLIPNDILVPAIVSVILATLAHFISVLMQNRSNKHDFSMKTFDSLNKDLAAEKAESAKLREKNIKLQEEITELRGNKYVTEATLQRRDEEILELEEEIRSDANQLNSLKELLFQANADLELQKKRVENLEARINSLE